MFCNSLVCQKTNYYIAIFGGFINDMDQTGMHNVSGHTNINFLIHKILYNSIMLALNLNIS